MDSVLVISKKAPVLIVQSIACEPEAALLIFDFQTPY